MKITLFTFLAVATLTTALNLPIVARDDLTADGTPVESDVQLANELAASLAESDEDYDAIPDGMSEADYNAELNAKDAEGFTIPEKREARIPNDACGARQTLNRKCDKKGPAVH
jgi:hypothetical protein